MAALTNWAGNIVFSAAELARPRAVADLQRLVADSDQVRVLGTGHSFNRVADTSGTLVSVRDLPRVLELDREAATVRVGAGIRYGELTAFLEDNSFALANLGSLPHISVAGACATGTHGSGNTNQVLAGAVRAQQLVNAEGELIEITASDEGFSGSVIGLGALGVVTELTLALVPSFEIRQYAYDHLDFADLTEHFDEITGSAYSFSVFSLWRGEKAGQIWLKTKDIRDNGPFFSARSADGPRHPLPDGDGSSSTEQGGVVGPWNQRLPHFRLEFTPSNGEEIQSEYFIDRSLARPAIAAIRSMGEQLAPVLMIGEIRTVAADELWISPAYRRDRVAFHFTWTMDEAALAPVVRELEARLAEFDAVPHWGKYFVTSGDRLAELHPRLHDFADLVRQHDPSGKFANDFVLTNVLRN